VFVAIARDEERHLRYCHAVAKRHAPDQPTLRRTVERYRQLEAQCFAANSAAKPSYMLDRGIFPAGPVEKWMWRALQWITTRSSSPPFTAYHATPSWA
jgi:hypothetical protein